MVKLNRMQIRELAKEIILQSPGGIRFSQLVREIKERNPETPENENSIKGSVWNLHDVFSNVIRKPEKGLFVPVSSESKADSSQIKGPKPEDSFYQPFAEWLRDELEEVTEAISLGGNTMRSKWGTPDVVGVYKPRPSDRIKFSVEIVSVEVKVNPADAITAFGQAAAYRLFSSKSYIAMASSISLEDYGRLESLCILFGIGLVLFDATNPEEPNFTIRVRAQRFFPDMFYVNEFAERLYQWSPNDFNRLFA